MSRFDPKNVYDRPQIQMIPLIDIMFFALIFFMILSVYYHIESQMDIHIPEASQAKNEQNSAGTIVININTAGVFNVNGQTLTAAGLENMLQKMITLSPEQSIVIRADQKTYHKYVIEALDICARNNIKDVAFATSESQK